MQLQYDGMRLLYTHQINKSSYRKGQVTIQHCPKPLQSEYIFVAFESFTPPLKKKDNKIRSFTERFVYKIAAMACFSSIPAVRPHIRLAHDLDCQCSVAPSKSSHNF
jgi:hypothetical protein